jgi:hypothetical protein
MFPLDSRRPWVALVGTFLLGLVAALTSVAFLGDGVPHGLRLGQTPRPPISSILRDNHGRQLVMIVVGSSQCGASRGSDVLVSIRILRDSLRAIARRRQVAFSSIGVALDDDPRLGLEWLGHIGGFDEVASGGNWLNTAAVEFIWREPTSFGAQPQVIVEFRSIERENQRRYRPPVGEVLIRMIGQKDITTMAGLEAVDSLLATRTTPAVSSGV